VWCYNAHVLKTPVTRLRKDAPGSLTAADVAAYFSRHGYPLKPGTISAFERAQFKTPPDRMFILYARAIGRSTKEIRAAYAATLRMKARKTGPFAFRKAA
jgi:hypothetical protein